MNPSESLSSSADFPVFPVIRFPAPLLSEAGRGGPLQVLGASLPSCCCFNPARVNRRFSQPATSHVAFAQRTRARPLGRDVSRPNLHSLSLRPDDSLTILKDGFVDRLQKFGFPPLCYPSYKALTFTLVGLSPTKHTHVFFLDAHSVHQLPAGPRGRFQQVVKKYVGAEAQEDDHDWQGAYRAPEHADAEDFAGQEREAEERDEYSAENRARARMYASPGAKNIDHEDADARRPASQPDAHENSRGGASRHNYHYGYSDGRQNHPRNEIALVAEKVSLLFRRLECCLQRLLRRLQEGVVFGEVDRGSLFEQLPGQRLLVGCQGGFDRSVSFLTHERVAVLVLLDGDISFGGEAKDGGGKSLAVKSHMLQIAHGRR